MSTTRTYHDTYKPVTWTAGVSSTRAPSRLTSNCVTSWCNWRASCVDSKPGKKNRMAKSFSKSLSYFKQNPCHILIQNLEMFTSLLSFMGIQAPDRGSTKNWEKLVNLHFWTWRFYGQNVDFEAISARNFFQRSSRNYGMDVSNGASQRFKASALLHLHL